jgi:hypothetical protein
MHERVNESTTLLVAKNAVRGMTADGKEFTERHLAVLKQREVPVLMATDEKAVDAGWLANVRPQMLTLITPLTSPPIPQRPTVRPPLPAAPPSPPGAAPAL